MRRLIAAIVMAVITSIIISACGADPYCDAIEDNKSTLNSFGNAKTNSAYENYAKTARDIAKVAPDDSKKDWNTLVDVTTDVLDAQESVGLKLEETSDDKKLDELSPKEFDELNKAYTKFNDTADQRAAVVKDVKQKCEITLQ